VFSVTDRLMLEFMYAPDYMHRLETVKPFEHKEEIYMRRPTV